MQDNGPSVVPGYAREPQWLPRRCLRQGSVPTELRSWLFDPGSLTRRVQAACGARFRVELLEQQWRRPHPEELRRLRLRPGVRALVRHVFLSCGEQPWVFARTVVPRATLSGGERQLARLGTRPLGAVLFADPGLERHAMEYAAVGGRYRSYAPVAAAAPELDEGIWGRRSLFCLRGKPLLVSEFFLPALRARACAAKTSERA